MKVVAPQLAARERSPLTSEAGRSTGTDAPRPLKVLGRGKSVGSSSSCGASARCCLQYARWASSSPLSRRERCHTLKSAYWIGSAGSAGSGCPARSAL